MIARIRARLAVRGPEAGLSLTELLTAATLSVLILAMVSALFIQTAKVTAASNQTQNSTTVASNIQNELTAVIRHATAVTQSSVTTAVVSGTSSKLVLYSFVNVTDPVNPAPVRVTFDGTGASLIETQCVPKFVGGAWSYSTCASSTTRNLGGILQPAGTGQLPLFTYIDSTTGNPLVIGTGSVGADDLPDVASITVGINVLATGSATAPTYLSSTISMPNLGLDTGTDS